ncbi:phosphotransferase [Pareuzebyella sediminis]|uniref:phosphotransferase n=1 Tax=Pareuzebyella sediminis TaxID=2607998 RepID=UPI0011EC34B0|nr:phosphotransferase [Pareuzebyella sediminis]
MTAIDTTTTPLQIQNHLRGREWINPLEKVLTVEKAGEGNMNVVLRIVTNERSFILKQSRPFVRKYPHIKAPLDRIAVEKKFYQTVRDNAVSAHIPKILGYDANEYLLLLEDLGHCDDMTLIYKNKDITAPHLDRLIFILGVIHRRKTHGDFPDNMEMRLLNHDHIFVQPFLRENDLSLNDIQPGLQELATHFVNDKAIRGIVEKVGQKYLSPGNVLIHGDYYPGSWMTENENLYVIDPEFAFLGFPEFDLGVLAAHIIMATGKKGHLGRIYAAYQGKADLQLMSQVAGIEIMRRMIGLAQLPLERSLKEKERLMKKARKMILS